MLAGPDFCGETILYANIDLTQITRANMISTWWGTMRGRIYSACSSLRRRAASAGPQPSMAGEGTRSIAPGASTALHGADARDLGQSGRGITQTADKANPRFIVTSLSMQQWPARELYEQFY